MRCLSPHARYSIQAISPRIRRGPDRNGTVTEWVEGESHSADFDKTGITDWEIEAALEAFDFSGVPDGVNVLTRIGVFDSEMYVQRFPKDERDALQIRMDERLRDLQKMFPNEFIIVDPPQALVPWPSYDEMSTEEILSLVSVLKVDPELVRRYEEENKNRPDIVRAMLELQDPEEAARRFAEAEEEIEVSA